MNSWLFWPANVFVCEDRRLVPVGDLRGDPGAAPVRHAILEFAHGTQPMARPAGRAHRIILRFSPVAFERDEQFLSMQPELGPNAGASMLAGLNGLAGPDEASLSWVKPRVDGVGGVWARRPASGAG